MIEREYKGLVSNDTYTNLSNQVNWDKKFVQVNFYYSNNTIHHHNINIRIRCKGNAFYLQIKVKLEQEDSFRICKEYKTPIYTVPQIITQEQLQKAWIDYNYGDVQLQGFLVTERFTKHVDGVDLMLDRNSYNDVIDCEVEMECITSNQAEQLVDKLGLTDKVCQSLGKYERFCKTL